MRFRSSAVRYRMIDLKFGLIFFVSAVVVVGIECGMYTGFIELFRIN